MKIYHVEPLDEEEKDLIKEVENAKTKPVDGSQDLKKLFDEAADNYLDKNKHINIRLTVNDIYKIKTKAIERGIPYQTLIASILHQYANDKISAEL